MEYGDFLKGKIAIAKKSGFNVEFNEISDILKPHQKDIVKWAINGGRRAIFASFGLGKTVMALEIMRLILKKESGKCLIIAPLGVRQEFKHDAKELLKIDIEYIKNLEQAKNSKCDILITNYERVRDGDIDPTYFKAVNLDEASVLRSYGSKTYQEFLKKFKGVKYKFVSTATPSPNKFKELIHYGGFLEVMDTGQALTRFFKRDSTKANKLTLHESKEQEFWTWLASWSLFITKPSDLGYEDTGYDLPPMKVIWHMVDVDHSTAGMDDRGQYLMFRDSNLNLKSASKEKRDSLQNRINKMTDILNSFEKDEHCILWHTLEAERHAIKKAIPEALEVYGSQDIDKREQRIIDFSEGRIKYIATKPVISGQGSNFQKYCNKCIFLGVDYKFNDFIQAIHRIYRFLQEKEVEIHIIYTESESQIIEILKEKWNNYTKLVSNMTNLLKEKGLLNNNLSQSLIRTMGIKRQSKKGEMYNIVNNDNIDEYNKKESDSLDLIVTSIPFSNHYEYTPSYNDFGHNKDNIEFFKQMDYLTPNLLRTLKNGRLACIHVKDRILFGNATGTGMPTVDPFSDMTVFHFIKHGFQYMGRITVETDVVRENNQTYRLGWTEQNKDGTKMGVGCPEYVLLFRKLPSDTSTAYADIPVSKEKKVYTRGQWQIDARAKWNSSGNTLICAEDFEGLEIKSINNRFTRFFENNIYNYKSHKEVAEYLEKKGVLPSTFETLKLDATTESVWSDITRMNTLNGNQKRRNLTQHICPLQIDIVNRLIDRYSNKGEVVADPFGGIMTVPYCAIKKGRIGDGVELNDGYYKDGLEYVKAAELNYLAPTLFNINDIQE